MEHEYRNEPLAGDKTQIVIVGMIAILVNIATSLGDSLIFADYPSLFSWMIRFRGTYTLITLRRSRIPCSCFNGNQFANIGAPSGSAFSHPDTVVPTA